MRRVVTVVSACVLAIACGSSSDSGFGSSSGDPGSSGGASGGTLGSSGGASGSSGGDKPCTNLCKQQVACPGGGTTSLSGTVFDPAGKVPLYDVIVYVPNAPVAPIKHGASCDRCGDVSGDPLVSAITDEAGKFTLKNVPVGANIPLVVQVGKWRRQLTIPNVAQCVDTPLDAGLTRLPKNKSEGDIPKIALTTGGADALECFLRKVGLEDGEFGTMGGAASVDFYAGQPQGGGGGGGAQRATVKFDAAHGGASFAQSEPFWSDANNLMAYDMVLLSCEGQTYPNTKPQAALDALYAYTQAGGRVFASHWHRYWLDPQADNNGPMIGTTKFTNLGTWNDASFPGSIQATVDTSFPKGQSMQKWLGNVNALQGASLPIDGSKKNLESVNKSNAQQWITYDSPAAVEYMSFNVPEGVPDDQKCGRVVYSDLHVSSGVGDAPGPAWPGGCATTSLSPQEKALEFMLFDLSACISSDQAPPVPPTSGVH